MVVEPVGLAVDLGTTHTVAVVHRAGQPPRSLLFDGSPLLSSAVFVDAAGTVHVGRDANRLGAVEPQGFEPHPKRRIDEGTVLLGDHEVPVGELLAASLRRVVDEARLAGVDPGRRTVLTCPADWGQPRRELLRAAAGRAGLGDVSLVDEPIAAATYCVQVLGQRIPVGGCLGIFDFGGGTLDVAVVRSEPAGLRVLATGGLDDLGGLDVDDALVAHLGQLVGLRDPQLWARLSRPGNPVQRRDRQVFWSEVRAAKEMLSRVASAPVQIPGWNEPMHLTREELERVAGPLVARAVDETRRVVQRAGVPVGSLSGLFLVGGSSRLPLVASRLHARLGVAPSVPEQPELPVAFGALRCVTSPGGPAAGVGAPFPPPMPVMSPSASGPAMVAPPAHRPVPTPAKPSAVVGPPASAARGRRRLRRAVAGGLALVTVAAGVAGATVGGRWLATMVGKAGDALTSGNLGIGDAGPIGDTEGTLTQVYGEKLRGSGAAAVTIAGDRVYTAEVVDGATALVAISVTDGTKLWEARVPVEPTELFLTVVGDVLVIDAKKSATDKGKDMRATVRTSDGGPWWKGQWEGRTDVAYYGTDVVAEIRGSITGNAILRVDLRTGKEKWRRSGNDDLLIIDKHRAEPLRQSTPYPNPKGGTLPAANGSLHDAVTAADTVVELDTETGRGYAVNTGTGKSRGSGALPFDESVWTAVDGVAVGKLNSEASAGRDALAAYSIPGFKRLWKLDLPAGEGIDRVKPCGARICAAIDSQQQDGDRTIAVDITSGKQAWSVPVDWSDDESWYVGQGAIVFGDAPFTTIDDARLLTLDGKPGRQLRDGVRAWATDDNQVAVSTYDGVGQQWLIWVERLTTDRGTAAVKISGKAPKQVVLSGGVLAVVTGDRQARVFTITGLT